MSGIEAKGVIKLKLENLSQYPTSGPETDTCRYSDVVYIQGLPWNIYAWGHEIGDSQYPVKVICFVLECNKENTDPDWSCGWVAMLSLYEEEYDFSTAEEGRFTFRAEKNCWGFGPIRIDDLMERQVSDYDEETDSLDVYMHVIALEPRGLKNIPDLVYKKYSISSEHSLFVDFKDDDGNGKNNYTSNLVIEDKEWEFTYTPFDKILYLEMSTHSSGTSKTIAECIFWFWNGKEIVILKKTLHAFGAGSSKIVVPTTADNSLSGAIRARPPYLCRPFLREMSREERELSLAIKFGAGSSNIEPRLISEINNSVSTYDLVPVNKKFNVVIRLMDKRIASENSVESCYVDYDCGLEKVTLTVAGTEKASFTVPKVDLFRASPVFRRMFTVEMKEKATCKIEEIPDTNPEEFGAFLKAISPKQEYPNPSNVLALLKLAHLYECQTLIDRCEKHLMNCVEISLLELLTFADLYGLNKLQMNLVTKLNVANLSTLHHISKPHITLATWFQK